MRAAAPLWVALALAGCTRPAGATGPDAAAAPAAPGPSSPREARHRSHHAMGTQITITAYTDAPEAFEAACKAAFAEFDRLEALLTVWRNDSDVSRVNAAAGQAAVKVGPDTLRAVKVALQLARLTDGKFDVTFGALAGLWRFDHDQDDRIPTEAEIAARLPLVGWELVELDEAASTVRLKKAGVKLHLGGIGKGFAVDAAVALLRKAGLVDFMVQAGGDLYVSGRRGERPWRVGIRDPRGPRDAFFAAAEVEDGTFSTSGDYERSFTQDGVRYHHILDPDLGRPARGVRSVTVMAKDAVTADALSTGVFILGVKRGLEVVEGLDGVGAVIVDEHNKVHISSRLQGRVKVFRDPTDGP
jgi:thiamine biosynthesis lipoprotein